MLCCVGLVAAAGIGLTACKKDASETTKASTKGAVTFANEEEASQFEERMQQDDNVVDDPFAEDGSGTTKKGDSVTTAKKGDSAATTKKGDSKSTTKKSAKTTTTKKSSKSTTKKSSKTTQAPMTDENGNQWSGWY